MFNSLEQELVNTYLRETKLYEYYTYRGLDVKIFDLKDLVNGDEYLNSLVLCGNGDIYTDYPIEELAKIFGIDINERRINYSIDLKNELIKTVQISFTNEDAKRLRISEDNRHYYLRIAEERIIVEDKLLTREEAYSSFGTKEEKLRYLAQLDLDEKKEMEKYLNMNNRRARLLIPTSHLPISRDSFMSVLYEKVLMENRTLIIDSAVPTDDYNGDRVGKLLIVNGINNSI